MVELKQHPLSAAFPPMPAADFAELTEDIATHGLQSSVVVYQGQVLDGWHRYQACLSAGVEPRTSDFEGADPVAFVLSMNLSRRHLTPSQRAAAVLECSEWRPVGGQSAPVHTRTSDEMAKIADVSRRTIQNAKEAIRKGKLDELKSGAITAKKAAAPERAAIDYPAPVTPEPFDERAELLDLAAEAMTIVDADDKLKAAMAEIAKAKHETKTISGLYDALKREVASYKRDATRWMKKAKKSAICKACKVGLERDDAA